MLGIADADGALRLSVRGDLAHVLYCKTKAQGR
jgi:hypothetical protein